MSFLFYEQPVALNRATHARTRVRLPKGNFGFAANSLTAPIVTSEFYDAAIEYPIVFAGATDDDIMPLVLLGLKAGQNLFVDGGGKWNAAYVPASVRAYPFLLVGAAPGSDQWFAWADRASLDDQDGERLFDDEGGVGAALQEANKLMLALESERSKTREFIRELLKAGLFKETTIQVVPENSEPVSMTGIRVIDETKFLSLDQSLVTKWHANGYLGWCYAHLLALRNVQKLVRRLPAR